MTVSVNLSANQALKVNETGDFFRLMEADLPITVRFYKNERKIFEAINVRSGYAETFEQGGYDRVELVNGATPNDVQYVLRLGARVEYDVPPTGLVEVTNTAGAFVQSEPAVTNAAGGVQVLAANPLRRYLLVQNNDALANLRITVDGTPPTNTHGVRVVPGGSFELAGYVPTGAVRVLADQATAAVTAVEG